MVRRFRVLEVDLSLEGPDEIVGAIGAAYERFKIAANTPGTPVPVAATPLQSDALLYGRFLATVLKHVERHAVFHAAAVVDPAGGGLVVAGPSGHGKSSLCLELVRRGFRFLGDDYAPVDLEAGTVWPFPRTASILPGGKAPVPEQVRRLAVDPRAPRLFGKALVDVGRAFGEGAMASAPAPIRTVAVLAPEGPATGPAPAVSWITMVARPDAGARLDAMVRAIPGVCVETEGPHPEGHGWRLRVEHAHGPTEALASVVEDDAVLYSERTWSAAPVFASDPEVFPLKRREAAVLLTRELLNRRRGSRFLAGRADDVAGLVLEVAHALRNAACWQLRVGRFEKTADLLASLTARRAP